MSFAISAYQPGLRFLIEEEVLLFLARRVGEEARILLRTLAEVDEERRVAAVVEDHVGPFSIAELEDPVGELPVLVE